MKSKGCGYCQRSGYRGRIAIIELMMITAGIRELIFEARTSEEIRKEAIKQGMQTLYMDGMRKVLDGITTFEEVYRVAKRSEQDIITEL